MTSIYDEAYFLRGRESGKSLYENYRWLPELTIPMVLRMAEYLGIDRKNDTILDFGCACGYTVKAFRALKFMAFGVDVSEWAIQNCDPEIKQFVRLAPWMPSVDWVIAKDVLEHVRDAPGQIASMMDVAKKGVFAIVPLSWEDGKRYVIEDYEKDVTHIHRLTLASWARFFMRPGWTVTASYSMRGIKDNYFDADLHPKHVPDWNVGNGFIVARK